jgi:hypothetical protein
MFILANIKTTETIKKETCQSHTVPLDGEYLFSRKLFIYLFIFGAGELNPGLHSR